MSDGERFEPMRIRVKFGKNPYSNNFACSHCGQRFDRGGFFLRIEYRGILVDIPICAKCYATDALYEGMIDLTTHHSAHPIRRA